MAKYGKKRRINSKQKNKAKNLTALAYDMGQVNRGLENPDSKISVAFNRGKTKPSKRPKRTLF